MSSKDVSECNDKGINEVLQLTDDLKLSINGDENSEQIQKEKEDHGHADRKYEDTDEDTQSSTSINVEVNPDIDMSDPDRVLQMLETVDLSEEDTELLLQEAYKMNRKLKEMLRHQESTSCPPDIQRQKMKRDKISPAPSHSGSRSESATFSASKPLPPIFCEKQTSNIYTMKLRRSRTNIPITNNQPTTVTERAKSSKVPSRTVSRYILQYYMLIGQQELEPTHVAVFLCTKWLVPHPPPPLPPHTHHPIPGSRINNSYLPG